MILRTHRSAGGICWGQRPTRVACHARSLSTRSPPPGAGYFWWEPIEQLRKLTLTGFVLLVPRETKLGRVIIAQSVSIAFLMLQLVCKPYRRAVDNWLMTFVQLALVLLFQAVLAIVTCDLDAETCSAYGFGSTSRGVFLFFGIFSIVMVVRQV